MPLPIVRIYTGDDGHSHFEDTEIPGDDDGHKGVVTKLMQIHGVQFHETPPGGAFEWHTAPRRQYVVTLAGELLFETRLGETHRISTGDVLLAEDTTGGGHRWKLVNDQPWRRLYIHLE